MHLHNQTVVFFCMPEPGHFRALGAVIARVVRAGAIAHVYSHRAFQPQVENYGARFVDLFARYSLNEADDQSRPIPCRYVSFAGRYADKVADEIRQLRAALIIYDTFSVIGLVAAQQLGIPCVCMSVGHDVNPQRFLALMQKDPRVSISERCYRAVDRLAGVFGLRNASPFCYISALSPYLNLYCEPPEFLDDSARSAFAPLAFFGCIPDPLTPFPSPPGGEGKGVRGSAVDDVHYRVQPTATLKVYIAFGTIIWRYFAAEAASACRALAGACAEMQHVRALISLGGAGIDHSVAAALEKDNVHVLDHVDQPQVLRHADLFVTHHGVNSTHEAIFRRVPMISYPFFWDQPALACKCQELGLALPLARAPRGVVAVDAVHAVLETFMKRREMIQANLHRASTWERNVMEQRDAVMQRIAELIFVQSVRKAE